MNSLPEATLVARARAALGTVRPGLLALLLLLAAPACFAQAVLSTSWTPASGNVYVPGCTSPTSHTGCVAQTYTWRVSNASGASSDTPALSTTFNAATLSWTCTASGGASCGNATGSGNLSHGNDTLPAGGAVEYAFTAWYAASATAADSVTGTANPDSGSTSSAVISIAAQPKGDLSIDKVSTYASYVPGLGGQYVLTVSNAGPSDISGTVTDTAPANVTIGSWSCARSSGNCTTTSGSGNLSQTIAIPVGITYTYTLDVSFGLLATGSISNTATVAASGTATDPVAGNNSDSASTSRVLQSLFTASFLGQSAGQTYIPGTDDNSLTLRVTNGGGSSASVPLSIDLLGAAVEAGSGWSCASGCSPASGSGDVSTTVTLGAGASADIVLLLDYDSGALANPLVHTAVLDVDNPLAAPDPANDPADIRATASYAINRRADLRVTKTVDVATAIPGQPLIYTITVANLGPSDVGNGAGEAGALLDDDFDARLRGGATCSASPTPCWTYCPSDDGVVRTLTVQNCPAGVTLQSGSGDIVDAAFELRAGSSSELRVSASTSPSTEGNTTVANTAAVAVGNASLSVTDPVAGNDSSQVSTSIQLGTDVAVTKTDGATGAVAGELLTYTVTVRNAGFNTANNVAVADALPLFPGTAAGFMPGSISWQCSALLGACCVAGGASDTCGRTAPTTPISANALAAAVDLPGQSSVVFTITGRVDAAATGTLSNTASATLPAGLTDSQPGNNSATDGDTVLQPAHALTVEKRLLSLQPSGDAFRLTYEILVANGGPSRAVDVEVEDTLGGGILLPATASWTCAVQGSALLANCDAASGTGALDTTVDLSAGGAVRFQLAVTTVDGASGVVTNTAEATSSVDHAEDTEVSNLTGTGDLSVSKTDNRSSAIPGTENEYIITVRNAGPDDVFGARLQDLFPPELDGASWSCAATTPVPGELDFLQRDGGNTGGVALAQSADGRHVYVASRAGQSVAVYQRTHVPGLGFGDVSLVETEIEALNDAQDVGGAVAGLHDPIDLALSTDGTMLYVLSQALAPANTAIAAFNRVSNPADPDYGKLSYAGVLAASLPAVPRRLQATPTNLYVTGGTGTIAIVRRIPGTGLPAFDVNFESGVPASPGPMAWSASDGLLFVGSTSAGEVAAYRILPASGPTPAGRLAAADAIVDADLGGAADFALAPAQRQLYVAAGTAGRVVALGYDASASQLQELFVYAATIGGANQTFGPTAQLALAPDGEHLLVSNAGGAAGRDPALMRLRRDATSGGLSFEAPQLLSSPGLAGASDLAVTPDGRHVLIPTALTGAAHPQLAVYTRRAPDPLLGFLELDREGDALPSGTLSGLQAPADVAVSPDGDHVYAVSLAEGALVVFRREVRNGADGDSAGDHLRHLATYRDGGGISGLDRATRLLVSPNGASVYVSSEDNNTVAVFARDPGTGLLTWRQRLRDGDSTPQGTIDGLLGAQGLAMDENATHLYVAGSFEAAVAAFRRDPSTGMLTWLGVVKGGSNGATGMGGMRDLVVTRDGRQVLGVGSLSNAVVAFNRQTGAAHPDFGRLTFLQARTTTGVRLMSLAIPNTVGDADDDEHVYTVGQDDDSLIVLRRVTDPTSSAYGTLSTLFEYRGLAGMNGPRDVVLSADGRRVYVGAQFDSSVLILDRDLNDSSMSYGALRLVETRSDGADGVDGLANGYALATSRDSRHVYVAGFGDRAIASFAIGSGSYCSAGGSGAIDDRVNIGAGGTLEYRVRATIRPDATGTLSNTVSVTPPDRYTDPVPGNNSATDTTSLTPQGSITLSKSNGGLSVVAGETVRYTVEVRNPGPSNLVHSAGSRLTFSDPLDTLPGFVPGSARWSCAATGSGALGFVDAHPEGAAPFDRLAGVGALALLADSDGPGGLPAFVAAAGLLDDAVTFYARDPGDGRLLPARVIVQGPNGAPLNATFDGLASPRALAASDDGRFLYVASRDGDAIGVFELQHAGGGALGVVQREVVRGRVGLDQPNHLALSPNGSFLFAAGSNDDAIAVFRRDAVTGLLTWVESEQNGVDDATDDGGQVSGLDGVAHLVPSPDGAHLYAVAGGAGSVARFDIEGLTGRLAWRQTFGAADFGGTSLQGAGAAVFDTAGEHLYLAAADARRILVLGRRNVASGGNFGELRLLSSVTQEQDGALGLLSPRALALNRSADAAARDRHLYVASQDGSSVAWFARDPLDGSLTFGGLRSAESSDVSGVDGASALALDSALGQLYVAGTQTPAVAHFERQSDSSCPASGTGQPVDVPFNIAAGGSVVFTIDVDVASTLSGNLVNTATVIADADPQPGDNSATDTDSPSRVADLSISKDDGLAEYDGLAGARALAGTATHLYSAGAADNAIGVFERTTSGPDSGALRFVDVVRSGTGGVLGLNGVSDLALSADGAHLYAISPSDSAVAVFRRGADGRPVFLEVHRNGVFGVTGLSGARAAALSPDGSHLYVVGTFSNAVAIFRRNTESASADFGELTFVGSLQNGVGGVDGLLQPNAVAVAPDGLHVYALGGGGTTLAVFLRNPNPGSGGFGQLSFVKRYAGAPGTASGLEAARALAFGGAAHLYVLGATPGTLAHFVRTPGNGDLALGQVLQEGIGAVSGLLGAQRLRLTPDATQLYVAGDGSVTHYDLDAGGVPTFAGRIADGDPAPSGGQVAGLNGGSDLLVSPDGAQVYVVAADAGALSGFERSTAATTRGDLTLRETLFDGLGGVAPGEQVQYRIEVANAGPAAVQARVVDVFPAEFVAVSWICTEQIGGALCNPAGSGNLDQNVDLPAGGRVVFEATGTLADAVGGTLVNTATVTAQGATDPDLSDNSATDGNTVLSPAADLVVQVAPGSAAGVPGGAIDWHITLDNLGPSYAEGARLTDLLPAAVHDAAWSCSATPVAGLLSALGAPNAPAGTGVAVNALAGTALGLHLYATVQSDTGSHLLVYGRDPFDGTLTPLQVLTNGVAGVGGIGSPQGVVLSSDERFVYVAGSSADAIAVFARDTGTGQLSYVTRYQDGVAGLDGLGGVRALRLAPGGGHLYAAGTVDDAIAIFSVNPATGLLTAAGVVREVDAGVDGLNGVRDLAFSGDGAYLLAVSRDNQALVAFQRNAATGALTHRALLEAFQVGNGSLAAPVALEVAGNRVFVASDTGTVGEFAFDPAAATPAFVARPNAVTGVAGASDLLFDPDQARLYVAARGAGQLHVFDLLAAVPAALGQVAAPQAAALLRVSGTRHLYSGGAAVAGFAIARGSRCAAASGIGALGTQPLDLAPGGRVEFTLDAELFANATGELRYTVQAQPRSESAEVNPADNADTDVRQLSPQPSLGATKTDSLAQVVAGRTLTWRMGLTNGGPSAAVGASLLDTAPLFPTAPAGVVPGSLAWRCTVAPALLLQETYLSTAQEALLAVGDVAVAPDGARVYAVSPQRDALLVYTRQADGSVGALQEIREGSLLDGQTVQGLDGASAVAVSDDGRAVLVTGAASNSLLVFERDLATGTHRLRQRLVSGSDGVSGLIGGEDVAISRDGRFVFVASAGSDSIAGFRRDPATGLLSFVERVRDGFGTLVPDSDVIRGVRHLQLSRDGANLYALAGASHALSSFRIDPASGVLTYLGVTRRATVAGLDGARDLAGVDGERQLYALGNGTIVRFDRQPDGRLSPATTTSGSPGLLNARALQFDPDGARLYVVDGAGALSLFARDWASGALAWRQRIGAVEPVPTGTARIAYDAVRSELFVSTADAGRLARYDERPLSHCQLGGATQDVLDTRLDLDVGGEAQVELDARVHPSARGVLRNTVRIAPGAGSAPAAQAQDDTTITVESDLSVTKSAPARAVAGTPIAFQIVVANAGPSDALGMRVVETLPAALRDVAWTCSASGTSSCPASGGVTLDFPATLKVGETLTIALSGRIAPDFTGDLANRVDLVGEPGAADPDAGDRSAITHTDVVAEVDVEVQKSDGVTSVVAGTGTTYQISVANRGPSDAPTVAILDPLPAGVVSGAWTCSATGGASCPPSGTGSIDFATALPSGGALNIQSSLLVSDAARGTLENAVSATPSAAVTETDPGDNTARDVDTLSVSADLQVTLTDGIDPFDPSVASGLPYEFRVRNLGPSSATDVQLDVLFNFPIALVPLPPGCSMDGQLLSCELLGIGAGQSVVIARNLTGLPPAPGSLTAAATVGGLEPDPAPASNADQETTDLVAGGDIAVTLARGGPLNFALPVTYTLTVANLASRRTTDIDLQVPVATHLVGFGWTCTALGGATCPAPSGSGAISALLALSAGESLRYTITAGIAPGLDPLVSTTIEQRASATVPGGQDINPANNTAVDSGVVVYGLFRDGFEGAAARPNAGERQQ